MKSVSIGFKSVSPESIFRIFDFLIIIRVLIVVYRHIMFYLTHVEVILSYSENVDLKKLTSTHFANDHYLIL